MVTANSNSDCQGKKKKKATTTSVFLYVLYALDEILATCPV